jgi:LuxR family maltose regulon positive regulatory protein
MILATKLVAPQPRPGPVARPALLERVRAGLERPLTLVAAPAGFGKTTLIAQALADVAEQTTPTVAWLALDPEDDMPLRFWLYVAAALDRAVVGFGVAALSRLQDAAAGWPGACRLVAQRRRRVAG